MQIVHQDKKKGVIKVIPETLDDLWHLSHIIEPDDYISSVTSRRIQDSTGERLRSDRGVKKTFTLGVRVENISFHKYTGKLRATGTIERGPEDLIPLGSHHTIDIKLKNPLNIRKGKWSRWNIKRLKDAVKASKKPSVIIVSMEDDTADLGIVRQYGMDYYGPIIGGISGKKVLEKNRKKNIINFYEEVVKVLSNFKDLNSMIIAGPGFYKDDFYDFLREKYPEKAQIAQLESTGSGGKSGIVEVLKKGLIEKMAAEGRIAQEMRLIDQILAEIGKSSDMVTYGKNEVKKAAESGAVEQLMVSDALVREEDVERIMDAAENMGGKVMIVSSEHDGGKQLRALGGIAALLRYRI
jgi:protein pelota